MKRCISKKLTFAEDSKNFDLKGQNSKSNRRYNGGCEESTVR